MYRIYDTDTTTWYPIIAGGDGGGQESTTRIPAPSPQELADREQIRGLAGPQQQQLLALMALQSPEQAATILKDQPGLLQTLQPLLQQSLQQQRQFASGGISQLSPADEAQLSQAYASAGQRADQDVMRFADQLAGGRGLRLSDTPVADVALRERSRLALDLQSQAAQQRLNLGLGLRQFQVGLQQQQFGNQLGLTQAPSPFLGLASMQQQERMAQPTTTTSVRQPFAQTFSQLAGGIGGLALGAGLGFPGLGMAGGGAGAGLGQLSFAPTTPGWSIGNFGAGFPQRLNLP